MLKPQRFSCSEPSSINLLLASMCHSPPSATVPLLISATPFTSVRCHSSASASSVLSSTGSRTTRISICSLYPISFFSRHLFLRDVRFGGREGRDTFSFYTKWFRGECRRQMRRCGVLLPRRLCPRRRAGGE